MTTVDDILNYAHGLVGLTADPSSPWRAEYLDLVAPGETPKRAAEIGTMFNCELLACAILRKFIAHPLLDRPYVDSTAGTNLSTIAREARAVRPMGALPQAGDIVIVSPPEHAWTCLGTTVATYDGAVLYDGLDGLPVEGHRAVVMRQHEVRDNIDDAGTRRAIVLVIDTMACVARFGRSDVKVDGDG